MYNIISMVQQKPNFIIFYFALFEKVSSPKTDHKELIHVISRGTKILLYSWKYWRELNLVVGPKFAIARILADLNLAVW